MSGTEIVQDVNTFGLSQDITVMTADGRTASIGWVGTEMVFRGDLSPAEAAQVMADHLINAEHLMAQPAAGQIISFSFSRAMVEVHIRAGKALISNEPDAVVSIEAAEVFQRFAALCQEASRRWIKN